jgi:hypothetical protein
MDMATIGAKALKKGRLLKNLDESEEINACTVKIKVDDVDGKYEELAAAVQERDAQPPDRDRALRRRGHLLGGAIRDPLSGRAYVYQAMRVTGAADPRRRFPRRFRASCRSARSPSARRATAPTATRSASRPAGERAVPSRLWPSAWRSAPSSARRPGRTSCASARSPATS